MQDYWSLSEDRSCHADENWHIGDEPESIHFHPARAELTRHKEDSPLMCSSAALERETLYKSNVASLLFLNGASLYRK